MRAVGVADGVKFLLRLPVELHAALKRLAERERRSLHAQILHILERAVEGDR